MAVLVDAGPLVAAADRHDPRHAECAQLLLSLEGPLTVPALVVGEVAHLLGTRLGTVPEVRLLEALARGELVGEPLHAADWLRIAELVWKYRDLPFGTVDASVVAAAERLDVTTVATLDRRHFSIVRPSHVEAFELVP